MYDLDETNEVIDKALDASRSYLHFNTRCVPMAAYLPQFQYNPEPFRNPSEDLLNSLVEHLGIRFEQDQSEAYEAEVKDGSVKIVFNPGFTVNLEPSEALEDFVFNLEVV